MKNTLETREIGVGNKTRKIIIAFN